MSTARHDTKNGSRDVAASAPLTVSEVARLAGVSVRTLHHYDDIGLLEPSERSTAGYRLYSRRDLERLQEILLFRELDIPLDDIGTLLAGGAFDRLAALELQHEMLRGKADRTQALIHSVERAINAERTGVRMTNDEMLGVFGDFDPAEYADEVKERWGESDAYRESARRTARYTKADWARFKAESEQIGTDTAALMDAGVPANDPRAMDLAEQARLQIDRWFYPCSHEMHVNLAQMYIADPRFTATYEKIHEGMARYWHDAIVANATRR
ncbi:MAG: MerR family transcriptional regulator [Coriobacteriia bacterium]|nr:MerR family transcriptional regulator [Coriobacteriia bacterium]